MDIGTLTNFAVSCFNLIHIPSYPPSPPQYHS